MLVAKYIQWDIDLEEGKTYEETKEKMGLPDEIKIPEGMTDEDEISDYLSEETGFCHYGFDLIEKNIPIKKFTVVGYDKDNDVYVKYKQFHRRVVAEAFAKELKKDIEKGTLTRKCSDGTLELIDWVQVVDTEDFDKVFWTSYERQERNKAEIKKECLNNLPIISKELADKILKLKKISYSEFIRDYSKIIKGTALDDIQKRKILHFRNKEELPQCVFTNMYDDHAYPDSFGIWNQYYRTIEYYGVDAVNHMISQAYKEFLANAVSIEYKGIIFDNWTIDEETGGIYGEMCEHCAKKYKDLLNEELSDGGMGACSVKGCNIVGMDTDTDVHCYVDFKPELIRIHKKKRGLKMQRKSLYHLFWEHEKDWNKPIYPSVPKNTLERENKTIPRICVAPSLDDCLTALGPNLIGMFACSSILHEYGHQTSMMMSKKSLQEVTFPFTVARFEVDRGDPTVLLPGEIIDYVPDAFLTNECWLTKPTVADDVEYLWLVNGKVLEDYILCGGLKYRYMTITDSEWSQKKKKPAKKFLQAILDVTTEWLQQDLALI